jgi:hypothetical protein
MARTLRELPSAERTCRRARRDAHDAHGEVVVEHADGVSAVFAKLAAALTGLPILAAVLLIGG